LLAHSRKRHGRPGLSALVTAVALILCGDQYGCTPGGPSFHNEDPRVEESPSLLAPSFERVWKEHTIVLGSHLRRGTGPPSSSGPGGQNPLGPFPVIVHATIVDSLLIEAGIQEFARLAGMDALRVDVYRQAYRQLHRLGDAVFVYLEMETPWTEEYLKPDRWILYVEDMDGHQVEPAHIVEHPVGQQTAWQGSPAAPDTSISPSRSKRALELYFPLPHSPHSHTRPERLKFVMVDVNERHVRAEGEWNSITARN